MKTKRHDTKALRAVRLSAYLACAVALFVAPQAAAQSRLDLDLYDAVLAERTVLSPDIVGTRVDYRALRKDARLGTLVQQLQESKPNGLKTRAEKLAFWINAYNILTLKTVVDHYPLESIKDVGSFFSPVWDRTAGRIGGEDVTLGQIEHEILRKVGEPRIHAAIVCASTSCPSLARTAFRPERLDEQLDAIARRWLGSRDKGVAIDRAGKRVTLSRIFSWFEEDFEAGGGAVRFAANYLPNESDAQWLRANAGKVRVAYFDYDWSLNEVR